MDMDNQLQQKFSAFEAAPPEAVWQRIDAALTDAPPTFVANLQEYGEAPGEVVWRRIENELNEALPAKLVPFTTRYKRTIRYAAAAAIIGVMLIVNTLVSKRTEAGALDGGTQNVVQSITPPAKQTTTQNPKGAQTATVAEWVTYKDSRGKAMRMPKKLFEVLECKNGDDACRRRIAEMQQKLSSTNATADFAGLLEMLEQLK